MSERERRDMICPHWQYLITLDSDLKEVSRYVEISSANFNTFSIEFVRLLLAAGSEIDVVAKLLCKEIDDSKRRKDINDYRNVITTKYPKFHTMIIDVPQYEIQLIPWETWKDNGNPPWWKVYNDVKHKRDIYFKDANLENTINAVAGLYTMIWYLHYKNTQMKKLNKTTLLSADRYDAGCRWVDTPGYIIPDN
ncbi:MAG: hypothetical protein MRK02_05390 [Candidatus Scalindua sp.]|nr:hypothetical protein [Candidatus Scalindua sp.]